MKRYLALLMAVVMFSMVMVGCTAKNENVVSGGLKHSQGVSDTQILIGNNAATSGAFGQVGLPYIDGIQAYLEMINESGGVHGRKIVFLHQDDEMNPEKGKAMYDKLINDDKVFAIVGSFGTPVVGAILDDLKDSGIPAVYFATGMSALYNENATGRERGIYPIQPIYTTEGRLFAAWAKGTFNGTKLGVIYSSDDAGKGLYDGITKQAKEIGLEVVAEQVPYGAEDVSSSVTKILSEGVDVVAICSMQNTFLTIAKELGKQGNASPTLTSYVNVGPVFYSQFADDIEGKYELYGPGWLDITQSTGDLEQMTTYLKKVSNQDWGPSAYAISGWLAAKYFVEGLKRIPEGEAITWENYMDALESAPIELGFGTGSFIDYSNGKRYGTETLALYKFDKDAGAGMAVMFKGFMTIEEILSGK